MQKFKKIKNLNFNNLVFEKFFSKNICSKIIRELEEFGKYDDQVMGGRKRINKGSLNFKKYLKISPESNKFYTKINTHYFFKIISSFFDKKNEYTLSKYQKKFIFSKTLFGSQSGKRITENKTNIKKNILYLDLDFSISGKGYSRGAHRDRDSRIINFLIYLNDLTSRDGGILQLFNIKNKKLNLDRKRFIENKHLKLIKSLKAKAGKAIFFESSPNSYHSVTDFYAKNNESRYFIYGSFSLNKKVKWKKIN